MIVKMTEETRARLEKDGSILKKLRIYGGMPMACMAGGVIMLIFVAFLFVLFAAWGTPGVGLAFGVVLGIPGLIMILAGAAAKNKQKNGYLNYYQKETGFTIEELRRVDSELMDMDVIMIYGPQSEKGKKGLSTACFITNHYLVVPFVAGRSYVRRIQDMIAVFYSEEIPGFGGYKHGMGLLSLGDDMPSCHAILTRETYLEAVRIMHERNPRIITDQKFLYDEKVYDLWKNGQDVVRLFEKQMPNGIRS